MRTTRHRIAALTAASALVAGGLATGFAGTAAAAPGTCVAPTSTVNVFAINDFHGRLNVAAKLFSPVEEARAALGTDHVLTISSGDNIGASTLDSMILDDEPTLDVLNAARLDVSTVGNHEFDKGWSDLSGRVAGTSSFAYLGANVYQKGTTTVAAPLKAYEIFERGGVKIAVVGAVTADTPNMVSPDGVAGLDFGDPVQAVNRVTAELLDGNAANGEADIVLASFHEGAASATAGPDGNTGAFASIYNDVDPRVAAIFNAHTHQEYNWTTKAGVPVLQAGQYGAKLAKVELSVDAVNKGVCATKTENVTPGEAGTTAVIGDISTIVADAQAQAARLASRVIGTASSAISTANDGTAGTRNTESPMLNLVAQMFADVLGAGDAEFIGVQNAGGTRDSWNAGEITYGEAALVLPFANSLFTTQLTGAQFKQALEEQWRTDPTVSRPFLALGLSDNVTYTYDESLPWGQRITSISVGGKPIDPNKLYTVGSGSFLIAGGDSFSAFASGVNTRDTGRADLEAWVSWVESKGTLSPDYSKRGVSTKAPAAAVLTEGGEPLTFTFGATPDGALAPQSLDMFLGEGEKVSPKLGNTEITAYLGDAVVGSATVTDGVATIEVALADGQTGVSGAQTLRFVVESSGTEIFWPVTVTQKEEPAPSPSTSASTSAAPAPTPSSSASPTKKPSKPGLPKTGD